MADKYFLGEYYMNTYEQRLKYMTKYFEFKDKTVLELGGAIGYISNELSKLGATCMVIEARQINIDLGKQLYPHLTFIQYDLENTFDFGKFDFVLNFGLIYHMKDFKRCITDSLNALNVGGILLIDTNVIESKEEIIREKRENLNILDQAYIDKPVYDFSYGVIEKCLCDYRHIRVKKGFEHGKSKHDYNNGRAFYVVHYNTIKVLNEHFI